MILPKEEDYAVPATKERARAIPKGKKFTPKIQTDEKALRFEQDQAERMAMRMGDEP